MAANPICHVPQFPRDDVAEDDDVWVGGVCGWLLTLRVWPIRAFRGHCDIYDESLGFRGDDTTG